MGLTLQRLRRRRDRSPRRWLPLYQSHPRRPLRSLGREHGGRGGSRIRCVAVGIGARPRGRRAVAGMWSRRRAQGAEDSARTELACRRTSAATPPKITGGPEALRGPRPRSSRACRSCPSRMACGGGGDFARRPDRPPRLPAAAHQRRRDDVDHPRAGTWRRGCGVDRWTVPRKPGCCPTCSSSITGWISQYPPGHLLLMAAFERLGAPWLLGPVLLGLDGGVRLSRRRTDSCIRDRSRYGSDRCCSR